MCVYCFGLSLNISNAAKAIGRMISGGVKTLIKAFCMATKMSKTFHGLTCNCSNQSGDHGPSGPSPLPQHTRLCQPLIESLGVHQSTREDITQGVSEPSVSCVSTAGDVFFPPIADQPGWCVQPAPAAHPRTALQTWLSEESGFFGELHGAGLVPQSP